MGKWSANFICYNEELWIPYQLKQLENAVDEIIIVDGSHTASIMNKDTNIEIKNREPHKYGLSEKSHPSTDNTRKIISEFKSNKIKLFDGEGDEQKFRNFAISKSSNDYILIVDADEFYMDLKKYLTDFELFFKRNIDIIYVSKLYEFYFDFEHYIINKNIPIAFKKDKVKFVTSRTFNSNNLDIYNGVCYHYSYIKPYKRIVEKMKGYGEKGEWWLQDVVDRFGKIPDERLIESRVNRGSIHFCSRNKTFEKEKLEHPEIVKPLINEWKWTIV